MRPHKIKPAANIFVKESISSRNITPTTKAPTPPIPVQTVYAVPSGKDFIATARSPTLATIPATVVMAGHSLGPVRS